MMKLIRLMACMSAVGGAWVCRADDRLWYDEPASKSPWTIIHRSKDWRQRCLPIGNGRLGGMIFGGVAKERIQFNEDTLWVGDESFVGNSLTFGDLYLEMDHSGYSEYNRELDVSRAVHTITYRSGNVRYKRQYLASRPDKVLAFHFTADQKGAYTGTLFLNDFYTDSAPELRGNRIMLKGDDAGGSPLPYSMGGRTVESHSLRSEKDRKRFNIRLAREAQLRVLHKGGEVKIAGDKFAFSNVDELTLLLSAGTDYVNKRAMGWRGDHPHRRITADLDAASQKPFSEILARHIADYRELYARFDLDLGKTQRDVERLTTDKRLAAIYDGATDPALEALIVQYGRYLMISSSRPGTLPAHLQGIWNRSTRPAWWGDFHTDVNIQMCYWFVDKANLSECYEPYVSWLNSIREVRKARSQKKFGVRGWTFGAMNGPFGGSAYYNVKGTAAWCAQNLFDHYRFTRDKTMLREQIYPILKELCWFWEDLLQAVPDPDNPERTVLVSPDGFSPEHGPKHVDGVSFDQQLIWDLFTNTIEAGEGLGADAEWLKSLTTKRKRLLKPRIGRWGQLMEWMEDIDDPKSNHRHLSHLIALHPGRQIAPGKTPKLAKAARTSLEARGTGPSGWSKVWRSIMWARLHDGERAYASLDRLIRRGHFNTNLFSVHDPKKAFQIDGNFGFAEAVCEMIVQSHLDEIQLLPALPSAWPEGSITGTRVRGGFEMDIEWSAGRLKQATLRGVCNDHPKVTVRYADKTVRVTVAQGQRMVLTAEHFQK